MTRSYLQRNAIRFAGLTLSPLAWACSTQLGQILPYVDCERRLPFLAISTFFLSVVALAGAYLSWSARTGTVAGHIAADTRLFLERVSALAGLLFTFALLLQGAATLVLSGCER